MKLMIFIFAFSAQVFAQSYSAPELKFTGYKFIEKEAVSGTFKEIKWNYKTKGKLKEVLESASLEIDSYSIEAGNAARNTNITNGLFKNWGAQKIQLKVLSYDEKMQFARVRLTIGKLTKNLVFQVSELKDKVLLTSSIDLLEMGLGKAFAELGRLCAVHHRGKDGVVKTWSTVDLEAKISIASQD